MSNPSHICLAFLVNLLSCFSIGGVHPLTLNPYIIEESQQKRREMCKHMPLIPFKLKLSGEVGGPSSTTPSVSTPETTTLSPHHFDIRVDGVSQRESFFIPLL